VLSEYQVNMHTLYFNSMNMYYMSVLILEF